MKNPELIRRIKFIDPETGKRLVFLTHNMTVSSEGVAISPVTLYNPAKHTMSDDCIYQHQGGGLCASIGRPAKPDMKGEGTSAKDH